MTSALPQALASADIPAAVRRVVEELSGRGFHAYLVGGCVRDILRGEHPRDFDVATNATPEQVMASFKRVIPTGVEHGTVTVVVDHHHLEVTTFRAEAEYVDGRRPSKVEFHSDIEADLSRRDFTINAMAYDPIAQRLVDPFGGVQDLAAKLVRCVGGATARFSEDGLRPLRAARFATVLDFTLDPATEAAIAPTVPIFRKVATERVNQELTKLLLAPRAADGLELLRRTGLLAVFLPEALGADFAAVARARAELTLRLAVLLARVEPVREVLVRLKYPTRVAEDAAHLVQHRALPPPGTEAELRRWLAKVGAQTAGALLALNQALGADVGALEARVAAVLAQRPPLTARELALDGRGIMQALGVGQSPVIGEATRHLLELVLEDPSLNSREALEGALRAWHRPPK